MKRRSFLTMSAFSAAIPVVAHAADEPAQLEEADWWETINSDALDYTAKVNHEDQDIDIKLHVQLIRPDEKEFIEVRDKDDEFVAYHYKDKLTPDYFYPGRTLLTRFDLTWQGKAIPIPERFWNDIGGLWIQTSTVDPSKLEGEAHWKAIEFLESLKCPRLTLSADGGTVLVEWARPEDCDSRSTYRWIISKSGNVLRHRDCPPHHC
jgi:hypothetical protein